MKKSFLLLLLLPVFSIAQTITVTNSKNQKSVAEVYLYCSHASVTTNSIGQADISKLSACKTIKIQHPNYGFMEVSFQKLQENNYILVLSENLFPLETVQLNFNKWEQKEEEIPIKISKISKNEIEAANPQTTADLLNASGNVFIQKSQLGGGSPMIRGFSTSRVLLVVDGVRMNNAIFREGNLQNVIALDANAIQNAEVIFGPGAVVYGSDAIGGVMDFHTLDANLSNSDKLTTNLNYLVRSSSANFEKTAHFDFNVGGEKLAWLSSFTFTDYDDQIMGSNGPDEYLRPTYQTQINGRDTVLVNPNPEEQIGSGFSQFNSTQKIRYRPNAKLDFTYGWHYSKSSDVPRYDRLYTGDSPTELDYAVWNYGPQFWQMHALNATYYNVNTFFNTAKVTAAFQQFEESRIDRRFGSSTLRTRTENVNAYSLSLDFEKNFSKKTSFYYGIEAVHNDVGSTGESVNINTGESEAVASRYPDGSSWAYQALYANLQQKIGEKINLTAGIRGNVVQLRGALNNDFYDFPFTNIDQDFSAFNGSVGFTYLPFRFTQFSFNLSNGFRAPNIDDAAKIFDSGDEIVVVPNTTLSPEYLYAVDFGVIQKIDAIRLEANFYYSFLENALVRTPFSFNGQDSIIYDGVLSQVQALQNIESALVYGAQFSAAYTFQTHWNGSASYHINTGETSTGDALRHVAPNFGRVTLGYKTAKFSTTALFNFNQEISFTNLAPSEREKPELYASDADGNPYSPAWQTVDLRLSYSFSPKLQLQLNCENILDVRYRPYSSGVSAAGRNLVVALRGSF